MPKPHKFNYIKYNSSIKKIINNSKPPIKSSTKKSKSLNKNFIDLLLMSWNKKKDTSKLKIPTKQSFKIKTNKSKNFKLNSTISHILNTTTPNNSNLLINSSHNFIKRNSKMHNSKTNVNSLKRKSPSWKPKSTNTNLNIKSLSKKLKNNSKEFHNKIWISSSNSTKPESTL